MNMVRYMVRVMVISAFFTSLSFLAMALESGPSVKVTPVVKTAESWDHKTFAYPSGKAELTALTVEIAPGGETGWHLHPVPTFGLLQEGELEVALKDGQIHRLKAGDVLIEVMNTLHNGRNVGTVPVKILVFFAGAEGQTVTVKESDVKK